MKRLGEEKGILVCEAKQRLNTKLFLDEITKWEPGRPHHLLLFQKMFAHMKRIPSWDLPGSLATIAGKIPPGEGFCHGDVDTGNYLG